MRSGKAVRDARKSVHRALDEFRAGVEAAIVNDGIFGIPGGEEKPTLASSSRNRHRGWRCHSQTFAKLCPSARSLAQRSLQGRDCVGVFGEDRIRIPKPPWRAWDHDKTGITGIDPRRNTSLRPWREKSAGKARLFVAKPRIFALAEGVVP